MLDIVRPRTLPESPNLEHLRKQARDLQRAHAAGLEDARDRVHDHLPRLAGAGEDEVVAAQLSRTDAQLVVAREHGFASWPRLKAALAVPAEVLPRMKAAIEAGDGAAIQALVEAYPGVRDRPFDWQDRKGRRRQITPIRYAHACDQQASVDALVVAGVDLGLRGSLWSNVYNRNLPQVRRLLARGVNPDAAFGQACSQVGPERHEFVRALIAAGATWTDDARMDLHRGDLERLRRRLRDDPGLVRASFDERFGDGGIRPSSGTLLHVAAAHDEVEAVGLLLDAGADIDAVGPQFHETPDRWGRALFDGSGGQTPVFYTIGRAHESFEAVVRRGAQGAFEVLLRRGADLSVRAHCAVAGPWDGPTNPGGSHIETLTPLGYALALQAHGMPQDPSKPVDVQAQIGQLRALGAPA